LTYLGRRIGNASTGITERSFLILSLAILAADDGTSVAHSPPRWGSGTGDECHDGLANLLLDELGRFLLGASAYLADHHDCTGLGVIVQKP
jgi:hypothetical protein